jgi:hypothetical protein
MAALHLQPITPTLATHTLGALRVRLGRHHTSHIDTNKRNSLVDLSINFNITNNKTIKRPIDTIDRNYPTSYFLHQ